MNFSFKAMWQNKCPRCRKGDIFIKPLDILNPLDMPKECAVCSQPTEPEPGFYYGAMFLSYGITSLILLPTTLFLLFYVKLSLTLTFMIMGMMMVMMFLKLLRGSRSLYFHLVVRYDENFEQHKNK